MNQLPAKGKTPGIIFMGLGVLLFGINPIIGGLVFLFGVVALLGAIFGDTEEE